MEMGGGGGKGPPNFKGGKSWIVCERLETVYILLLYDDGKFMPFYTISFITKLFVSIPQCCKNYLLRPDVKSPTTNYN